MESSSICNHTIIRLISKFGQQRSGSPICQTSMITNRIGRQKVLLPSNHNRYNFRKQHIHLGQISRVETMSKIKKVSPSWKFLCFLFLGWVVVAMVIVIISAIGKFWLGGLGSMIGYFNCPITANCRITALQNDKWKIKQLMHQSHLRKLQWLWLKLQY